MAAEFKCYTTPEPSDNKVVPCNADINKNEHCFTVQTTDMDGETEYKRGCAPADKDPVQQGCIVATVDGEEGSLCFESCTTDKCNTHTNLNSSAPLATGSLLAALFYMLM